MSHIVKIITKRERKQHVEYNRMFQLIGDYEGNGYVFPCDSQGNLCMDDQFVDCWYKNYEYCLEHPEKYKDMGIEKTSWWYTEPGVGQCSCGGEVVLNGDCQCEKCGQWYNGFGQALKDPEYWEGDCDDGYDYEYWEDSWDY